MVPKTNTQLTSLAFCDIVRANSDREDFTLKKFWSTYLDREIPAIVLCGVRKNALDLSHLEHFMFRGGKLVLKANPSKRVQLRFRVA